MLAASVHQHIFQFKQPSGTSRGILTTKSSWIVKLWNTENPSVAGIGEASIIDSLSPDWGPNYESKLAEVANNPDYFKANNFSALEAWPSIRFAFEAALIDLNQGGQQVYFPGKFTSGKAGININGLIWMGDKKFMQEQIDKKLEEGYSCLKLKIGALDFETELEILEGIRQRYSAADIELRVDANGAFQPNEALAKLDALAKFDLHSIEQPIKQGQWEEMRKLCKSSPLPIALDEELIGVYDATRRKELIEFICPPYIILKPSLVGGFKASDEWIELAEQNNIRWWITSALEGNIGLNAIAQYTYTKNNPMPQGLGTGQLFTNNFPTSMEIKSGQLFHNLAF